MQSAESPPFIEFQPQRYLVSNELFDTESFAAFNVFRTASSFTSPTTNITYTLRKIVTTNKDPANPGEISYYAVLYQPLGRIAKEYFIAQTHVDDFINFMKTTNNDLYKVFPPRAQDIANQVPPIPSLNGLVEQNFHVILVSGCQIALASMERLALENYTEFTAISEDKVSGSANSYFSRESSFIPNYSGNIDAPTPEFRQKLGGKYFDGTTWQPLMWDGPNVQNLRGTVTSKTLKAKNITGTIVTGPTCMAYLDTLYQLPVLAPEEEIQPTPNPVPVDVPAGLVGNNFMSQPSYASAEAQIPNLLSMELVHPLDTGIIERLKMHFNDNTNLNNASRKLNEMIITKDERYLNLSTARPHKKGPGIDVIDLGKIPGRNVYVRLAFPKQDLAKILTGEINKPMPADPESLLKIKAIYQYVGKQIVENIGTTTSMVESNLVDVPKNIFESIPESTTYKPNLREVQKSGLRDENNEPVEISNYVLPPSNKSIKTQGLLVKKRL